MVPNRTIHNFVCSLCLVLSMGYANAVIASEKLTVEGYVYNADRQPVANAQILFFGTVQFDEKDTFVVPYAIERTYGVVILKVPPGKTVECYGETGTDKNGHYKKQLNIKRNDPSLQFVVKGPYKNYWSGGNKASRAYEERITVKQDVELGGKPSIRADITLPCTVCLSDGIDTPEWKK